MKPDRCLGGHPSRGMVKLLLHGLAATYVTVTLACPRLYSKQQVHLRMWRAWQGDTPEIM
jgi:hypothetical protein